MSFEQAPRRPEDGSVSILRAHDQELLLVKVTHDGQEQTIVMSEYNAARVFGMLALMLGIELPTKLGMAIHLGMPPE